MPAPHFTIILPTYNRARLLPRAIDSVLAQTCPDFELVVVDDGSTDDTAVVVARYRDPRIVYVPVPHGERSRARNAGLARARGAFVAFLDSDDWYLPHKLEAQGGALIEAPAAGMSLAGWRTLDPGGRLLREDRPWLKLDRTGPSLSDWLFAATAATHSIVLRRSWLDRVGGFDERLTMCEDVELWIRLALAGCGVAWCREVVAVAEVHADNSVRDWRHVAAGRRAYVRTLFENPAFADGIGMTHDAVLARFVLGLAWEAYAAGLVPEAQAALIEAVTLDPGLRARGDAAIVGALVDHAGHFLVPEPVDFAERVFGHLPDALVDLEQHRRTVVGTCWRMRAYRGHRDRDRASVRHAVPRVWWHAPRYLADRGMASMLAQAWFGRRGRATVETAADGAMGS